MFALYLRLASVMLLLIVALVTVFAAPAAAQIPDAEIAASIARLDSILDSVSPATPIRLQPVTGPAVSGTILGRSEGGLILDTGTGESLVSYPIATVWLQRPATGRGARIGAIAVGLTLGLGTIAFAEDDCDVMCVAPFVFGVGLAGAGLGALAGAVTGSMFHVWRRVLP